MATMNPGPMNLPFVRQRLHESSDQVHPWPNNKTYGSSTAAIGVPIAEAALAMKRIAKPGAILSTPTILPVTGAANLVANGHMRNVNRPASVDAIVKVLRGPMRSATKPNTRRPTAFIAHMIPSKLDESLSLIPICAAYSGKQRTLVSSTP
ncbi:predicted protein [Lichtheimia corymbifera JMRC:FSU:9682]|uniref:Uncharacterized protein n=1 Tax=Lichtheimia corymbifera JMRC:FSU:9682 TaxID=1263082 RepID=A0A068S300_9FUNG|nr:predicted protein [Lichtheimia corymbifera JMRC:FSU:9682]